MSEPEKTSARRRPPVWRLGLLCAITLALAIAVAVPTSRSHVRDATAVVGIRAASVERDYRSKYQSARPADNELFELEARGDAARVLLLARSRKPPPGSYQPGDLLFARFGAGGYWGHVAIVSEHGYVIEAYPPDVHEAIADTFLDEGAHLGWMRLRALDG